VGWACRGEQTTQVHGLDTTHIIVRLIGRVDGKKTCEIALKVSKEGALKMVDASMSLSVRDLQDLVADATPFVKAPIVMISTCDADEEVTP
jgi:hypothetical protein